METFSPEVSYLTRDNIVHPLSNLPGTQGDARIAAEEVAARAEASARRGLTVTGGSIRKGK